MTWLNPVNSSALETERLLLRAPADTDLDAVYEVHGDPATNQFNPSGPVSSREAAQQLLQLWQAHWQRRGFGYWGRACCWRARRTVAAFVTV